MDEAKRLYPDEPWKENALRHAIWQYLMTCAFGSQAAKDIGDIHEDVSNDPCDSAIDQYNNEVARQLAAQGGCSGSLEDLINMLIQHIENGDFVTDPTDPRVRDACPQSNQ